jgi:hypothetical protein
MAVSPFFFVRALQHRNTAALERRMRKTARPVVSEAGRAQFQL